MFRPDQHRARGNGREMPKSVRAGQAGATDAGLRPMRPVALVGRDAETDDLNDARAIQARGAGTVTPPVLAARRRK